MNPGDNSRKKFRDGLRRRGLLPPDTSDSEPGSDSNTSNLSPDDPIFDGARDSDDTHDWNPELKRQLKHFRVSLMMLSSRSFMSRRSKERAQMWLDIKGNNNFRTLCYGGRSAAKRAGGGRPKKKQMPQI